MGSSKTKKQFESLGFDIEQLLENEKNLSNTRSGNRFICICGHPVSRHTTDEEGNVYCKPSRMFCHCQQILQVVEAEDTRGFYRRTNSYGPEHALMRGMISCIAKDKEAIWVEDKHVCMFPFNGGCEKAGLNSGVQPVLLEIGLKNYPEGKLITNYRNSKPSEFERKLRDVFLCPEHLDYYVLGSR